MKEIIKKLGLIGIGAWALTEEKIEKLTNELVEEGEINKEEGKKFIKDMFEERKQQKAEIESKITEKVQETFKKTDLLTKEDLERLEKRLDRLEKKW